MPIFEYQCQRCSHIVELLQKRTDGTPDTCSSCEAKNSMYKKISNTSFQLKGSGWYKDLYSSKKPTETKDTPLRDRSKKPKKANSKVSASEPAQ